MLVVELVGPKLLQQVRDVLDGLLPLAIGVRAHPDGHRYEHERSGHGEHRATRGRGTGGRPAPPTVPAAAAPLTGTRIGLAAIWPVVACTRVP